jgi:fluoride exporter
VPRESDESPAEAPIIDLNDPPERGEPTRWDAVALTSLGGIIGAEARYGVARVMPHTSDQFPWSTVLINVSGCLAIGVLMVVLLELRSAHRLVRPFLAVGILGGYTTYSTFAVDAERLLLAHRPGLALGYVAVTLAGGATAVYAATAATRAAGRRWIPRRDAAESAANS